LLVGRIPPNDALRFLSMLNEDSVSEKLFNKEEARAVLRVSKPTLDRMISRGELSVVRLSKRVVRVRESALRALVEGK